MASHILGIHHVTALCGPAQENVDFYTGVLGLRLVKVTVNYDDPTAYHLYYGDGVGTPGSLLSFFPYPNGYPGRPGRGQATVTSLRVPPGSLPAWTERFREYEVDFDRITNRLGVHAIPFRAPDGLQFELVSAPDYVAGAAWNRAPVGREMAISGVRGVTLSVGDLNPTERVLVDLLGFRKTDERDNRRRYEVAQGGSGRCIDVLVEPTGPEGRQGHGNIHHVAFRVPGEPEQLEVRNELVAREFAVSDVMDRTYFKSIYFREPGGVVFEIATDVPGFTVDESPSDLGSHLCLPKKLELRRGQVERALPKLKLPEPV
jgi:glyoxalase family protein